VFTSALKGRTCSVAEGV